jgi:hypothetical protein
MISYLNGDDVKILPQGGDHFCISYQGKKGNFYSIIVSSTSRTGKMLFIKEKILILMERLGGKKLLKITIEK